MITYSPRRGEHPSTWKPSKVESGGLQFRGLFSLSRDANVTVSLSFNPPPKPSGQASLIPDLLLNQDQYGNSPGWLIRVAAAVLWLSHTISQHHSKDVFSRDPRQPNIASITLIGVGVVGGLTLSFAVCVVGARLGCLIGLFLTAFFIRLHYEKTRATFSSSLIFTFASAYVAGVVLQCMPERSSTCRGPGWSYYTCTTVRKG
ncbi:hypothetical protein BDK51DRAFT_31503 [Blyttiomyces helicus]|uniref:Uncharacterized protein n=1 Tax=Blyttiomyces helicus TaxID=388810 RepID=A0A4P9WNC6_9FUNG|nr:hypothetical protein BDK51DRAFT_31503 [Blyttiomyces helicus]|eukprot:RKO94002.1 hypothetical protein BDK51DRAFT_31503 [Blyttiomyces helicus]